jgi:hypothetical protein
MEAQSISLDGDLWTATATRRDKLRRCAYVGFRLICEGRRYVKMHKLLSWTKVNLLCLSYLNFLLWADLIAYFANNFGGYLTQLHNMHNTNKSTGKYDSSLKQSISRDLLTLIPYKIDAVVILIKNLN